MKKFSDFSQEGKPLDGAKVALESVLNKEIMIVGHKITHSRYNDAGHGKCLTLQFELAGSKQVLFTGSQVLIDQLTKYADEIPFTATIIKIDRYYTLS